MDIFHVLTMVGGLSIFLFGMNIMGQALERRAGHQLRDILAKMTTGRWAGFLTGCGITAIIQSSSATTVMVVGFVNSGLMSLSQSINVIMGANVGTTITSWILSLSGISGNSLWIKLLKPSSFTPVLALIGIFFYMFSKKSERKDTGMILLGFATLMLGMETMTSAVSGLAKIPAFQELFITFQNPLLGLLVGAVLTAVIQSSSASVGILQALAITGQVSVGAAVPIIMGQNIGTCVTALLSSIGANKNARRAAFVHLTFNLLGSGVLLAVFVLAKELFLPAILNEAVTAFEIAMIHSIFNLACVVLLMPFAKILEKLACKFIPDQNSDELFTELDTRLLATPSLALAQCENLVFEMTDTSLSAIDQALQCVTDYSSEKAETVRTTETKCDHYEDVIGTFLVNLSSKSLAKNESEKAAALLKVIGDLERISDHAVNVLESAEELRAKKISLTPEALREFSVLESAIRETLRLTFQAFRRGNTALAQRVEPLEEVIDQLKESMRSSHILRLQEGICSIEAGFVWSDLLTDLERISDHCSNIACCIIDVAEHNLNLHETQMTALQNTEQFQADFKAYSAQFSLR